MYEIIVLASALKRDLTENDILHAIARPVSTTYMEDDEHGDWTMIAGPDLAARLIEVGVRVEDETMVAFHSYRPARPQFLHF